MPAIKLNGRRMFAISLFDLGFSAGICVGNKAYIVRLPFPLRLSAIKYSIKYQGWIKSIRTGFKVE